MGDHLQELEKMPPDQRWPHVRRWIFEDPLPFYAELRQHRPILSTPEVTIVAGFHDCAEILRRSDVFSVALYRPKQGDYWMAQDDTAVHWREKSVMRAILDREDIPAIRTYVAENAATLLDASDGSMDMVGGLTRAVPISLVQDWFGFADSDPVDLCRWSYWNQMDAFWNQPFDAVAVPDPTKIVAEREAANEAMRAYLIALVRRRTAELTAGQVPVDLVSRLLVLSSSGALRFDVPRVVLNVGGLLIGAVETTSHAVVNVLEFLMGRPDDFAAACAAARSEEPGSLDGFVFEALRFKPAFPYFFRTCEEEISLGRNTDHEVVVSKGTTVLALTHSAMFDPVAFNNPDHFDPGRGYGNLFHFGLGLHECLGRAIAQVMIPEMVRQALLLERVRAAPVDRRGGPVPERWDWTWS